LLPSLPYPGVGRLVQLDPTLCPRNFPPPPFQQADLQLFSSPLLARLSDSLHKKDCETELMRLIMSCVHHAPPYGVCQLPFFHPGSNRAEGRDELFAFFFSSLVFLSLDSQCRLSRLECTTPTDALFFPAPFDDTPASQRDELSSP